jgi:hypothetical protein
LKGRRDDDASSEQDVPAPKNIHKLTIPEKIIQRKIDLRWAANLPHWHIIAEMRPSVQEAQRTQFEKKPMGRCGIRTVPLICSLFYTRSCWLSTEKIRVFHLRLSRSSPARRTKQKPRIACEMRD